jgi:hypothetical protein
MVKKYMNPGFIVEGESWGGPRLITSRLHMGVVKSYLDEIYLRGAGTCWVRNAPALYQVVERSFILWRWQPPATTMPEYANLFGHVNASPFLGLPAGTCFYEGTVYRTKYRVLSNSGPFKMGYRFTSLSLGFYTFEGWVPDKIIAIDPTLIPHEWNDVRKFGWRFNLPPSGNFNGFISG